MTVKQRLQSTLWDIANVQCGKMCADDRECRIDEDQGIGPARLPTRSAVPSNQGTQAAQTPCPY